MKNCFWYSRRMDDSQSRPYSPKKPTWVWTPDGWKKYTFWGEESFIQHITDRELVYETHEERPRIFHGASPPVEEMAVQKHATQESDNISAILDYHCYCPKCGTVTKMQVFAPGVVDLLFRCPKCRQEMVAERRGEA